MNSYSRKLFQEMETGICEAEDFLDRAESGEFCFVENTEISGAAEKIDSDGRTERTRKNAADFKKSAAFCARFYSESCCQGGM